MPVISVRESWEGRQGSDSFKRRRTYTRTYEVFTSSPYDGPEIVGSCPLLPRLGFPHPNDLAAIVQSIKPSQDSSDPQRWLVSVDYDTECDIDSEKQDPKDVDENPLNRPPVFKFSFQQVSEVTADSQDYDLTTGLLTGRNKPIRNSAKLPFDPPLTIEVSRPVVTVTVNRAVWSLDDAIQLQDAVNDKPWQNLNARVARCIGVEAGSKFENKIRYWEVQYSFALKRDTWDIRLLDAGFAELIPSSVEESIGGNPALVIPERYVKITDAFGREATEPVPLNGSGRKLRPGDPAVFRVFRVYKERDFSTLVV